MLQTVSIGAVIVAVAGWAIYTQTDLIRPTPVVEASDAPLAVEAEDQEETVEEAEKAVEEIASDDDALEESDGADESAEQEAEAQMLEDDAEPAIVISPPTFDVVRVESDGMTVIAGTGPAGWLISILVDGVVVETVEADASGQFVVIVNIGESQTARVVTLSAKNADQIVLSEAQVIIAPVVRQVAVVEDEATDSPVEEETEEAETVTTEDAIAEDTSDADATVEAEDEVAANEENDVAEASDDEADQLVETVETDDAATEVEVAQEDNVSSEDEDQSQDTTTTEVAETEEEPEASQDAQSVVIEEDAGSDAIVETTVSESAPEAVTEDSTEETTTAEVEGETGDSEEQSEPVATDEEQVVVEVVEDSSPAVILVEGDDVQVLQPASESPVVMDQLSISAISYSDDGAVQLAGISPAGFLRVYLNNSIVIELIVPEPGEWSAELVDVAPGVYTLRIDQIAENGDVLQRVETPFKREEPAKVIEAAQTRRPLVSVEVVQPGSTLWAISRENYGSGVLFVRIFEANKDQIRNPDLIYPGQIFDLPAPPGAKKKKRTSGQ